MKRKSFMKHREREIVEKGSLEVHYPLMKIHSTQEWKSRIDPMSQMDGENHANVKGDKILKLHGGKISFLGHVEKMYSQIVGAMLDGELNIDEWDN